MTPFEQTLIDIDLAERALLELRELAIVQAKFDAKQLGKLHHDVYEMALCLENDGAFYADNIRPRIAPEPGDTPETVIERWLYAGRAGVRIYRRRYADAGWQPPKGAAELLGAYFQHVKYADLIAEAAGK